MKYYSVKDLQGVLGIGRCKAYELFHSKDFPAIKLGELYRVSEADLESWLKSNSVR